MNVPAPLSVRLLALGEDGAAATAAAAAAVRRSWAASRLLDWGEARAGDGAAAARAIRRWCDRDRVDVVLTVGRAGHTAADFAPEATAPLLERRLPGVEERMYLDATRRPLGVLFRGCAGLRRGTLVVNLPCAPAALRAVVAFLEPVIGHALEKARGSGRDCARPGGGP